MKVTKNCVSNLNFKKGKKFNFLTTEKNSIYFNFLNAGILLNCIQVFTLYRAENTLRIGYKQHSAKAVRTNKHFLFRGHRESMNELCGHNVIFLNSKTGGSCTYH